MKREILFRAQRIDNKAWVEGLLFYSHGLGAYKITTSNGWIPSYSNPDEGESTEYVDIKYETVCQFTGLTDKNGTKIFEGDIIKIFWDDDYSEETITYDCKYGYYMYGNNPICELIGDNEFEVIGNIYDNPELLK